MFFSCPKSTTTWYTLCGIIAMRMCMFYYRINRVITIKTHKEQKAIILCDANRKYRIICCSVSTLDSTSRVFVFISSFIAHSSLPSLSLSRSIRIRFGWCSFFMARAQRGAQRGAHTTCVNRRSNVRPICAYD